VRLLLVGLCACGRIGFDPPTGTGIDGPIDAGVDAPVPIPCATPGPLTTDFTSLPSWGVFWTLPAVSSASSNTSASGLVLVPSGVADEWAGVFATPNISLRSRQTTIEVVQATDEATMLLSADNSSVPYLRMQKQGTNLNAFVDNTSYVLAQYDPAAHRFWRIREQAGSLFLETSPDDAVYTTLFTEPTPSFVDSVKWSVGAGTVPAIASPGTGLISRVDDCLL